jgi:hypothetical protein
MLNNQACEAGYMCDTQTAERPYHGEDSPYSCPRGYYCDGTTTTVACAPGKYNPNLGGASESDCLDTPMGYFTEFEGTADYTSEPCYVGYYCPAGSSIGESETCPSGTFRSLRGAQQESDCGMCPSGYFCPP